MPQIGFAFEVKSLEEETGEFVGYASTYGNPPDVQNDVVLPGAFTKTLSANKERTLYYNHRVSIGTVQLTDSSEGLIARGKLSLALQEARDAHVRLKDRIIRSMSIGYETVPGKSDIKAGVRYLSEIKLWEVSLVEMPANPLAVITAVKSVDADRIQSALNTFERGIQAALRK